MHPIAAFISNPVKVAVGVLLVCLFGVVALLRMPMQLTPEVQVPTLTIETRWPGASPQEVEREIVREQEEQLQSVEGVTKMTSESRDSVGTITLEFLVGSDMEESLLKVNSRLQQVPEYPEDADEPVISTANSTDRPIAWFIISARQPDHEVLRAFQEKHPRLRDELEAVIRARNPGLGELRLRRLAEKYPEVGELVPESIEVPKMRKFAEDHIETQLERVPGVANSNVLGGQDPELQVIVDPRKLAARQLTILDVRQALRAQNQDTSGGDFWEGKRRYVVRTMGQFRSPEQVEAQIVDVFEGAPVYVRDVATVVLGHKKPDGFVRRYGNACLAVNAQRETGANVLDVMEGLRLATQRLNDGVLKDRGLVLTQVYDETDYIDSAVGLVNQNIVVGGILTVAVLLIFLRSGRSTLIIGLAIPTSIVGTFLVLHMLGRSLNVISLAGLAFAVGMLVDNAVVVLENIYRHYQEGAKPFLAAQRGTQEVWGAVIASTLTTLAVFLPVLFIQEEAGQLFRDIALAISAAVALSLVVSVTLIPTATARILREVQAPSPGELTIQLPRRIPFLERVGGRTVEAVVQGNAWLQRSVWMRLALVALMVIGSVGLTFLLWPKVEYLPSGNRNLVFGIILPPAGYNLEELASIGQTVETALEPYWNVDPESPEAQQLDYPVIADFFFVARGGQVFVGLRSHDPQRARELEPLVSELRSLVPGAILVARQSSLFEQGIAAGRAIDIEITGPELEQLVLIGGAIMGGVMTPPDPTRPDQTIIPGAQARPIPSLDLSSPEVHVLPRLFPAAEMGVTATDLGYSVDALVDGAYATDYFLGGDKIDLVIKGDQQYVKRTQDLAQLPMATPMVDRPVPLSSLADVRLTSGPEQVNHRERQRAITIQVTPPEGVALGEAIEVIENEVLAPLKQRGMVGPEYAINLSGTADKLRQTWFSFRWVMLLALLITYLLMAALFESWVYPFVIILSVPLAAVGGVIGLRTLGLYSVYALGVPAQTLDVLTMLGFVILVGTSVNNAILIVHQARNYMTEQRMPTNQALLESVRTRVRPIVMTTTTTVFGLAPLVLFPGAGSELYRGLGSVVLGGLLVSTVFTLFFVPTLFSLVLDLRAYLGRRAEAAAVEIERDRPAEARG